MIEEKVQAVINKVSPMEKKKMELIYIEIRKRYNNNEFDNIIYIGLLNYLCDAFLLRYLNTLFVNDPVRGLVCKAQDEALKKNTALLLKAQENYLEVTKRLKENYLKYGKAFLLLVTDIKNKVLNEVKED